MDYSPAFFPYITLSIIILFYLVIGYPSHALIHCIASKQIEEKVKTRWILAMIILWPIANYFYGVKYKSKASTIRLIICVLFIIVSVMRMPPMKLPSLDFNTV